MSQNQLIAALTELQELRRMQEELIAEIESLQDQVKDHMTASGAEMLQAGPWKVSYKAVTSSRVDAAALRKALPEVAERFMKTTVIRRFCVQ